MAANPSKLPMVEKAQQLPQLPWFNTGLNTPLSYQFIETGGTSSDKSY